MDSHTARCRWCGATTDLIESIGGLRCRLWVPCHERDMKNQEDAVVVLRALGYTTLPKPLEVA